MDDLENSTDLCAIYVDLGTTNTRVWLMQGREVLAQATKQVGVRDSAREGTTAALRTTLKELIARVRYQAKQTAKSGAPVCVVAAGMIGSPLGLADLLHIPAPAGWEELSAAASLFEFPDITTLPFLLVPGMRSGSRAKDFRSPLQFDAQLDVMRGEETLCAGLHALGLVEPPAVVLTLGSHWKAIQIAADGRIFIATDLDALVASGVLAFDTRVIISGRAAIAEAWAFALSRMSLNAVVLTEAETETAFLAGLNQILIGKISIGAISNSESTKRSVP